MWTAPSKDWSLTTKWTMEIMNWTSTFIMFCCFSVDNVWPASSHSSCSSEERLAAILCCHDGLCSFNRGTEWSLPSSSCFYSSALFFTETGKVTNKEGNHLKFVWAFWSWEGIWHKRLIFKVKISPSS